MLKKWLHEPLLHFLMIGAVLFFLYSLQNEDIVDSGNRIVISEAHVNRLVAMWEKRWQRPPTEVELAGLIEQQVREEVLYREALTMGLDKHDSIVRRRLAQKVEFISADIAAQAEPSEKQLIDYLDTHPERFEIPERVSFRQVYLSIDIRGDEARKDAVALLAELRQPDSSMGIDHAGDAFVFGQQHQDLTEYEVARLFGKDFAGELFALADDAWQGPVYSGYGLHLVHIDSRTALVRPGLDKIRDKVRDEWLAEERRMLDKSFYESLRQRYEIVIENTGESKAL